MAALENDIKALGWAIAQAGVANVVGKVIDKTFDKMEILQNIPLAAKVALQFGGGVILLGSSIRLIVPKNEISPVGDAILIYWFYEAQPGLKKRIGVLRGDVETDIKNL